MEPVTFKEYNIIFAKNQPEYLPLPAHVCNTDDRIVTTCWKLTWKERLQILFSGQFYFQQMTFGHPLQPQKPSIRNPLHD